MKSKKILLVIFLVTASVIGLASLQDGVIDENQQVIVNEVSSEISSETSPEIKTINVQIGDGVGSGDSG